jgi:hypothetical protein
VLRGGILVLGELRFDVGEEEWRDILKDLSRAQLISLRSLVKTGKQLRPKKE